MTTAVDENAEALIHSIRAAFLGVQRGTITLHEAKVIDNYGTPEARAEARKHDTDRRWEQVPDTHIEKCGWSLSHVNPQSWQYYIAPLMIWSLRYFHASDSIVSDYTIYTFDPQEQVGDMRDYALERYRLLNEKQAHCVCRFLRYMARNDGYADDRVANEALRKYWGQFCDTDGT